MIRIYGGFDRYFCRMLKKPRGSHASILSLFLVRSGCPPCFSDLAIATRSVDRVQCGSSVPSACRRRAERAWGESPLSGTKKHLLRGFFMRFSPNRVKGRRSRSFKCEDEGVYLSYMTEVRDMKKGRLYTPQNLHFAGTPCTLSLGLAPVEGLEPP